MPAITSHRLLPVLATCFLTITAPTALGADPPVPASTPAAATPPVPPPPPLPMATPAMLANQCVGCHGVDGVSMGPASPSIAGINEEYFMESMKDFQSGKRHSTVMGRIAKGYNDDELKAMAGFFARKKWVPRQQKTDAKKVAAGARLHKKQCEKCHEKNGRESEDGGILAGQWLPYLTYQMEDYVTGVTKMPEKMDKKVQALKADEIEALLHFYASQK